MLVHILILEHRNELLRFRLEHLPRRKGTCRRRHYTNPNAIEGVGWKPGVGTDIRPTEHVDESASGSPISGNCCIDSRFLAQEETYGKRRYGRINLCYFLKL